MRPDAIQLTDWQRILVGQAPWSFLLEILGRALLIYVLLLVAMRLMGRRLGRQLTQTEMAVVVSLGAAIGVPMQSPDRGVLPAVVIFAVAIALQRGLNAWSVRRHGVEVLTLGRTVVLVEDGRMLIDNMRRTSISRERLFAVLRTERVHQLGQVRRVYFETSGDFSIFLAGCAEPGLSIVPDWDERMAALAEAAPGCFACRACGHVRSAKRMPTSACERCGECAWTAARNAIAEQTPLR